MSMYDFTAGFSFEQRDETWYRKVDVIDTLLQSIYTSPITSKPLKCLKLEDIRSYLTEKREKYPQCEKCLLHIEEKKSVSNVTVILLDGQNRPLRRTNKGVLGMRLRAETLDESLIRFMDGAASRIVTS